MLETSTKIGSVTLAFPLTLDQVLANEPESLQELLNYLDEVKNHVIPARRDALKAEISDLDHKRSRAWQSGQSIKEKFVKAQTKLSYYQRMGINEVVKDGVSLDIMTANMEDLQKNEEAEYAKQVELAKQIRELEKELHTYVILEMKLNTRLRSKQELLGINRPRQS